MRERKITPTEMLAFFQMGIIGKLELRNWLSEEFTTFKKSRRNDVDTYIEEEGIEIAKDRVSEREFE